MFEGFVVFFVVVYADAHTRSRVGQALQIVLADDQRGADVCPAVIGFVGHCADRDLIRLVLIEKMYRLTKVFFWYFEPSYFTMAIFPSRKSCLSTGAKSD